MSAPMVTGMPVETGWGEMQSPNYHTQPSPQSQPWDLGELIGLTQVDPGLTWRTKCTPCLIVRVIPKTCCTTPMCTQCFTRLAIDP